MTLCMALLLAWGGLGTAQAIDSIGFNLYTPDPGWWGVYTNQVAGFTDVQASIWYTQYVADANGTNDNPIVDNHGIETLLTVSWTAPNTGTGQDSQPGTPPADWGDAAGNSNLFVGYLESLNGTPLTFTVTNIPYASYDVYVYMNRNGEDSGTDGSIAIGGATYYYHPIMGWNGVFTLATRTTPPSPAGTAPAANYCKFTGLTGASQTITAATIGATDNGGAISGFQIVNTAGELPHITLYPPSPTATETGPVDFPASYMWATTMNLTLDKVSLAASEGSVSGTVEILNPTSAIPTIRVKDITGFGKVRLAILAGSASNANGAAGTAGPSQVVSVYPLLPGQPTAPATGSKLWWDASNINGSNNAGLSNDDPITSWKDRSGNNNDGTPTGTGATFTASVGGFKNKPAVSFHADKANEKYDFATSITDVRTVFWAIEKRHAGLHYLMGANDTWTDSGGYGWHAGDGDQFWNTTWAMPEILNGVTQVNGNTVDGGATPMTPFGYTIVSLETTGPAQADFFTGDARNGYNDRSWTGDLAELIIYNRVLTPAEKDTTGRYLSAKYGMSIGYPTAPAVTLVYPAGAVAVLFNTPVELKATAVAGAGARIAAVEFYVDWQLVGTVTTPNAQGEYVSSWTTPGTAGSHPVLARALDNNTPAIAGISAVGTIIAVSPTFVTTTGTGSGASWAAAASITDAFSLSEGIIYMKVGTYNVAAPLSPPASAPALAVYGGFAGTETTQADRAPTGNEVIFDGVTTDHQILLASLPTTLDRLTFKRAKGTRGGAVGATAALTINNCKFQDNVTDGMWWDNGGAAVHVNSNNVTITNSTFTNNTMPAENDGVGGAIVVLGTSATGALVTIKNCVFTGNASDQGGAAQIYNCPVAVDSCWFEGNSTTQDSLDGGALHLWLVSRAQVTNCVFKNNTAFRHGGAITLRGAGGYFVNNTFVGNVNDGASTSDGIWERSLDGEVGAYYANNIFTGHADNAVGTDYTNPALIVMKNNLLKAGGNAVPAGIVVSGTITTDPLFVSTTDLRLQATSTAINAGTIAPYTLPNGLAVAYAPRDYAGLLRFDGQPDLGAYERAATGPLAITPDPLSFGIVVKETTSTKTLTLANTNGNLPITISAITPAGTGFSLVDLLTLPVTLLAGESLDIVVAFTAPVVTARVPHSGTVTVVNTGAVTPAIGSLKAIAAPSLFPGAPPTVIVERSAGTPAATKVFPIEFNITFSEGVTGFELGDINWAAGDVKVGNITATLIPREASGAQYTVRITEITGMGAGSWTVKPVVPAGVCETIGKYANLASNTDAVVTYSTALFGAVIATTASDITGAASVTCTVTFNGQVKAVDARALIVSKLDLAGTSTGASIASVLETNASTAYTVEITTGGDGTLALTLTDDDTIQKASTLAPLNGAGSSVIYGPMIEVDKTSPTLVAIQRAFGAPRGTNETVVVFEVTFSDIVTGVDAGDFTVTCNDLTADVASVATLGNTALVVCNVKAAVGTYALSVKTAATMTNRVGLGYETATPDPNETYFILTHAPQTSVETWSWTLY